MREDCAVPHYCYICDKDTHSMSRSQVLKHPSPRWFYAVPEMLPQCLPAARFFAVGSFWPTASPTALITVSGGTITTSDVEKEVASLVQVQTQWKWEPCRMGRMHFWCLSLVCRMCLQDLHRGGDLEIRVWAHHVMLSFSEWRMQEIVPSSKLQQVWGVNRVPHQLQHFLELWGM